MLIITRFCGQSVMLGDAIEVRLDAVERGKVTLVIITGRGVRHLTLRRDQFGLLAKDGSSVTPQLIGQTRVRLGFTAPLRVTILRREVWTPAPVSRLTPQPAGVRAPTAEERLSADAAMALEVCRG